MKVSAKIYLILLAIIVLPILAYLYPHITTFINKIPVNKFVPSPAPKLSTAPTTASSSSFPPQGQSLITNSFEALVKEVRNGKLVVESQDNHQTVEIPLDKNVTLKAWVKNQEAGKPPILKSAKPTDLKAGQDLNIRKTTVNNKASVYDITILDI